MRHWVREVTNYYGSRLVAWRLDGPVKSDTRFLEMMLVVKIRLGLEERGKVDMMRFEDDEDGA